MANLSKQKVIHLYKLKVTNLKYQRYIKKIRSRRKKSRLSR